MNREQLGVLLSTFIIIGIALFAYASSKSGKSSSSAWVWLLVVPWLAATILAALLRGMFFAIGWPIGRLSGQDALFRKWLGIAEVIIMGGCFIFVGVSTLAGLGWLAVHIVMGS